MSGSRTLTDEERLSRLGAQLAPELELVRLLGEGSMARVYLAREPALRRAVAVKVVREEVAARDVARRRFEREAQAVASITHPNITAVYRVGRLDDGVPYMVMEYIEGRRVEALLESRGPLAVDEARRVLAAVASALQAAHRKGVVHRDLRPDNIMEEAETGRIVLTDFGLAALTHPDDSAATRLTAPGERLGDPSHMSPEQMRGQPVTQASDIYAFGVLAFELLTGAGPFRVRSDAELIGAQLTAEPPPLQSVRSDVDATLASLVRRCLAKSPEHRPLAGEVYDELVPEAGGGAAKGRSAPHADGFLQPFPVLDDFWRELKRRKVVRVAATYAAGGFILLQGAQLVLDGLPLANTEAWYRVVVATVLLGFPLSLVLSWVFDFTSSGIQRTAAGASQATRGWLRLALPVVGLVASLLLAIVLWRALVG